MRIIDKQYVDNGRVVVRLCGVKILSYMGKKCPQVQGFVPGLVSCDIARYDDLVANGTIFPHLVGIVISRAAKIGRNCVIYQNVTIGAKTLKEGDYRIPENYPVIGNNVTIYAGAVIVGSVRIGNNCIIGANSVVLGDVPDNCTAVGVPAKVIKKSSC